MILDVLTLKPKASHNFGKAIVMMFVYWYTLPPSGLPAAIKMILNFL